MNGRQQGNTALSSYLHLYGHTLHFSMFLVPAIHITKQKLFTFLYTMIAFIFAVFRINDIVQSWPLEFSCYAFSVNHVQKMREAESSGAKRSI